MLPRSFVHFFCEAPGLMMKMAALRWLLENVLRLASQAMLRFVDCSRCPAAYGYTAATSIFSQVF